MSRVRRESDTVRVKSAAGVTGALWGTASHLAALTSGPAAGPGRAPGRGRRRGDSAPEGPRSDRSDDGLRTAPASRTLSRAASDDRIVRPSLADLIPLLANQGQNSDGQPRLGVAAISAARPG
eukprot:747790-Hanusia_phi.AAC.1